MTVAGYLAALAAVLAVVLPLGVAAGAIRRRWLPHWSGAPALLADLVVWLGLLIVLAEALGTFGQLRRWPLVLCAVASSGALVAAHRRGAEHAVRPRAMPVVGHPAWAAPTAWLVTATAVGAWTEQAWRSLSTGVLDDDSLQYHLPFAARFAQTGHLSRLDVVWLDPQSSFYPNNGELLHAIGMVATGRDILSPLIALGWLAVGLLAAWVLGRAFGVGHLAVLLAAVAFCAPLTIATQAGSALSDAPALALVVATLALVAQGDRTMPAVALGGLAAGLAIGTKVTTIAPLAAVTLAMVILTKRGDRSRTTLAWTVAAGVGGGYWYVRNLLRVGSPLPAVRLPGLSSPRLPAQEAYGYSVAHYLRDGGFWRHVVPEGLRLAFGPLYLVVMLLAALGILSCVVALGRERERNLRPIRWTLLATAVVGGGAYIITPYTAYGPPGRPFLFTANLRYLLPALLGGLLLAALASYERPSRWGVLLAALTAGVLIAELSFGLNRTPAPLRLDGRWIPASVAVCACGLVIARSLTRGGGLSGRARVVLAIASSGALLAAAAAGQRVSNRYLDRRYTREPIFAWARAVQDARIAVVGYPSQYPLAGLDLSNRVEYLGHQRSDGSFVTYESCREVRDALRRGHFGWFVTGSNKWGLAPTPEGAWERGDPAATLVLESGGDAVFRLDPRAPITDEGCA